MVASKKKKKEWQYTVQTNKHNIHNTTIRVVNQIKRLTNLWKIRLRTEIDLSWKVRHLCRTSTLGNSRPIKQNVETTKSRLLDLNNFIPNRITKKSKEERADIFNEQTSEA